MWSVWKCWMRLWKRYVKCVEVLDESVKTVRVVYWNVEWACWNVMSRVWKCWMSQWKRHVECVEMLDEPVVTVCLVRWNTGGVCGNGMSSVVNWLTSLWMFSVLNCWLSLLKMLCLVCWNIDVGWLFGFYGISTFVGYLTSNPFLYK